MSRTRGGGGLVFVLSILVSGCGSPPTNIDAAALDAAALDVGTDAGTDGDLGDAGPMCTCTTDADCDDGAYCNGDEHCGGCTVGCTAGTPVTCTGTMVCDDATAACVAPPCAVPGWYFADGDGDGAGAPDDVIRSCAPVTGRVRIASDCADADGARHPGAVEACDGDDDDCDGAADEGCPCPTSGTSRPCVAATGACITSTQSCDSPGTWGRCNGAVPVPESCNAADDDCDGTTDEDGAAACGSGSTCAAGHCSVVHPVAVMTRDMTSYALMSDGTVYRWGAGSMVASRVSEIERVGAFSGVDEAACAVMAGGRLACSGDCSLAPSLVCTGALTFQDFGTFPAVDVSVGGGTACIVAGDGALRCWGNGREGQLGSAATPTDQRDPIAIVGVATVREIANGGRFQCAIQTSGVLTCWGRNDFGQLGNGSVGGSSPLVTVPIADAIAVTAGARHACARRMNGDVMCWGADDFGEIGDGAPALQAPTPVRVPGIPSGCTLPTHLAWGSTCVITPVDGHVMCWGAGTLGQLGDGRAMSSLTPVEVSGLAGVRDLSGGDHHWCAVTATDVWCWGQGTDGEVGTGRFVPGRITGLP